MKGTWLCVWAGFDLDPSFLSICWYISWAHSSLIIWLYMYVCTWGVPFLFHLVSLSLCRRRDKVIIFSDMVFALRSYAQKLQRWDSNFSLNCPESIFPSSFLLLLPPSSSFSLLPPPPLFSFLLPFLSPHLSLYSSQAFHWRSDSSKWADASSTKLCPQSQHQHHFYLQGNVISLMHTLTQMAKAREKLKT